MNTTEIALLTKQDKANFYTIHGDISKAECVIGFSFGYIGQDKYEKPGKSNEQLAAFIEKYFPATPLILQFEIDDALKSLTSALVIREARQKGEYLNSREIAEQSLIFMNKHGWKTAAVVTHPAMEARNDAVCKKLGIITITPSGLEAIEYDSNSAQSWTRDPVSWWEREEGVLEIGMKNNWL